MKRLLTRGIPIAFYIGIAVFLFLYLRTIDFGVFRELSPDWRFLGLALTHGMAFRYLGAFIWIVILRGLGAGEARYSRELVYVYAKSWLGRYIPGTAPWILGKIYFASQHGVSKTKLGVSSLLEAGTQIIVLLIASSLMLVVDPRLETVGTGLRVAMVAIIVIGVIALWPPLFNRLITVAYRWLKKGSLPREHLATGPVVMKGVALYGVGAILSGLSLFFVAKAVDPSLGYSDVLFVIGVGNLAGALGMLAVFTPSGLGVREATQLALLSLIMPTEFALVVTVTTRLWGIITDLIFFSVSTLAVRRPG